MLWQDHERHIAKSNFPQFPDVGKSNYDLVYNVEIRVKENI